MLDWWPMATESPRDVLTTVMNWVSYKECKFAGETWGKRREFLRFIELPSLTAQRFEIAMGMGPGKRWPTELLRSQGWRIIQPDEHLPDPWSYRNYLRSSKGEWSIAEARLYQIPKRMVQRPQCLLPGPRQAMRSPGYGLEQVLPNWTWSFRVRH